MAEWKIAYDSWKPEEQPLREALCTLGNGNFATRGAAEESSADEKINYPGTYLAGGFNRLVSKVSGKDIENEDLVNWPNWLPLTFRHTGEEGWFELSQVEVTHYRQELDMYQGLLTRQIQFRDSQNRETHITSRRFLSMANPHVAALEWELTPQNWSGEIEVRSALDGRVKNSGVARYRSLASQHLVPLETGQHNDETIFLLTQTTQSHIRMAQVARTRVFVEPPSENYKRETKTGDKAYTEQLLRLSCKKQHPLRIEKVVMLYTSRDFAVSEIKQEACTNVSRLGSFSQLLHEHCRTWRHIWDRCDLEIASNHNAQRILRLHIFHLLQTVSGNTVDLDVGVPARGLHGEAYRGHIFWDELFIFPFLNLRLPELTRELLMYRYRRLPEARYAASQAGYRGAMFPWQSGSNGREESQVIHLNPESGNWLPDNTFLQRHINAAIAYNVWQYYQSTTDLEFLSFYGAEMIFDIAQFWSTIATYNEQKGRFEILHVVGPDEYHTEYPDSEEPGLRNNAYTNVMAAWVIRCALGIAKVLDNTRLEELYEKLHISADDRSRWEDISHKMFVPFIEDGSIIAQFEGYEQLQEFDWEKYKKKHGESMRLDRILESEGDNVNKYKASKQADVIMLFYLFSSEELLALFQSLGYELTEKDISANIDYYENRTSHGSTLSKIVHSWVLARSDRKRSWSNFLEALMSDVSDVQGGTTQEGIHLGAMAGTVDLLQRGYVGLDIRENVLWLNPALPVEVSYIKLQLRYRGHWLTLLLTHQKLLISVDKGFTKKVKIGLKGQVHTLQTGDKKEFEIS
ncbi:glycoside hydrolase family 65 protein [Pontibacter qinzhouensis]|uniref:Glycoside hydrolase family 65 protein n=1 Tax=Pontibacter qinzhouensis TaxID=2603253 RepID=A0A5C8K856_9BACT|nr:glycosyl hydrolase family 65 protein [Pontibacter qinzhouensis]TXK46382.1 glycoside hydrolase family 65 protein [Pontibacter qinzhouensis]